MDTPPQPLSDFQQGLIFCAAVVVLALVASALGYVMGFVAYKLTAP